MNLNLGEDIIAAYLQYIKGCEFIQKNLYTPDVQGEIDVVRLKYDQKRDIDEIKRNIEDHYNIALECTINEKFEQCLGELREYAKEETKELKSPVLRLMQIEERLRKHVDHLSRMSYAENR